MLDAGSLRAVLPSGTKKSYFKKVDELTQAKKVKNV